MNDNEQIISNLKKGKKIISITNFITSLIFLLLYFYLENIIFIIVALINFVTAVVVIIYFNNVEAKYNSKINKNSTDD